VARWTPLCHATRSLFSTFRKLLNRHLSFALGSRLEVRPEDWRLVECWRQGVLEISFIDPSLALATAGGRDERGDTFRTFVASGPLTNVPIRRKSSCFSGPLQGAMRKAPISMLATWPPEGRLGSCLTNTRPMSGSRASNHRSPLALFSAGSPVTRVNKPENDDSSIIEPIELESA
jgi:hypothetical protein